MNRYFFGEDGRDSRLEVVCAQPSAFITDNVILS